MILTKYDSYKDSGVEWLGEIPNHWEVKRVKDICEVNKETLSENGILDKEIIYVDIGSVDANYGVTNVENMYFSEAPSRARRIVRNGDIIISTVRTYLKAIAYIDKNLTGFIVSTGFATLTPNNGLISKYLYYSVFSNYFIERIMAYSVGVSYPAIDSSFVRCNFVLITRKEEQIRIANFLDKKTSQIDRKIELLQEKKETYEELKKTLISETVCRGLNKDVELKESGIEWIGEIPKHWIITRGKNIFYELCKSKISASEGQNQGKYKFFTSSVNQTKWINTFTENSEEIIFSTGGIAGVHYCDNKFSYSTDCWAIKSKNQFLKYFYYYFKSILYEIDRIAFQGAGLRHLQRDFIKLAELAKPTKEEQIQIANYLDEKTSKIDKIILIINDQIETLKEFRKTLINDVVTGKVRIQDE